MNSRYRKKLAITNFYKKINFFFKKDKKFRTLMYHSLTNDKIQVINPNNIWELNFDLFKEHIFYLKDKSKLKIYSLEIFKKKIPNSGICITFDDGYLDTANLAAPLLLEKKIPFTIFVITNYIKNYKKKYMNEKMLKNLSENKLVTIGSHGLNHKDLTKLSDKEILDELKTSKSYLENLLNKEIHFFSYPFGKFNKKIQNLVLEAGYKFAFSSKFNFNRNIDNPLEHKRVEIWNTDNLQNFKDKINGDWDWLKFIK